MEYTAKQIENAKRNYNSMLVLRTVESYEPQYIGWAAAEQRCEYHNRIVSQILAGNKELEKEWKLFIEEIWQKEEQQNRMHKELICVTPGENRQLSVMNAMTALKGRAHEEDLVIIHDAARPNLSQEILTGLITAAEDADGVVPVLPMKDTVYSSADGRKISGLLNREEIYAGQAPEAFRYGKYDRANRKLDQNQIRQIHGSTEPAVMAGMDIRCIPGDEHNYKITTEEDLKRFREEMEKI